MSNGYEHHFGPRPQTDAQAANSATPDTDRKPYGDDPGQHEYLMAVDASYRIDWYLDHGDQEAAREEAEAERDRKIEADDWTDDDEADFQLGWGDDDDDDDDEGELGHLNPSEALADYEAEDDEAPDPGWEEDESEASE